MIFKAFCLALSSKRIVCIKILASSLVVFSGKALNKILASLCGRQVGGVKQFTKNPEIEPEQKSKLAHIKMTGLSKLLRISK